ncbi:MAG TPA: hypothetical protein VH854_16340 [Thermoanaerobaculia bacterium]|jgi:hypothetical protein|nr:hypothetical protein [Thermoanaerobaculia bacterium]
MRLLAAVLALPLSAVLAGAASAGGPPPTPNPSPSSGRRLDPGNWGGVHVGLEVTASGARLEFDCAHGTIDGPIVLDADGSFEARGTQTREGPGPTRQGQDDSAPGTYSGSVKGDQLTLRVTAGGQDAGTFTLTRGRVPRLFKCA